MSIGIDVSKKSLVVAGITTGGIRAPRTFANTSDGACALAVYLTEQGTAPAVPCVIESTGDLHLQSSLILSREGRNVKCINPLITKKYQRSTIRNAKSDTVDAVRLAEIGIHEPNLPSFIANISCIRAKKMVASCAHLERLAQMLTRHCAQMKECAATLGFEVDLSAAQRALAALHEQRAALSAQLVDERSERARTLSGQIRGLTDRAMAVVDTFLRERTFTTRDELVAFMGLDVMARRSGEWRGKECLSKRGNPYVRKILYQIAWGLSRHHPTYRAYYLTLRAKNKHFLTCMMAVARKFLRFLFAWYFGSARCSPTVMA